MGIQNNLKHSFSLVKDDIITLQQKIMELQNTQNKLLMEINKLKAKNYSKTIKTVKTSKSKTFIASKTGKKFHETNCPFAKNIKPKAEIKFKSKTAALNKGYKPCNCVLKIK